jgi:N-acyl-D-amino-acid deacylase
MLDFVLKNGLVIDPANLIQAKLNIGIQGSRIACVTKDEINGSREIDCTDRVITPGFVDCHAHEDALGPDGKIKTCITERLLCQGITTFIGGQCGIGPDCLEKYSELYDQKEPINLAMLSAHGVLRQRVGANDKYAPVAEEQLQAMCLLLDRDLSQGAYGVSFGVRYVPGTTRHELIELAKVCKKYDGVLAVHVRDDCERAIAAFQEIIDVATETAVRVQMSHLGSMAAFGQMKELLIMLDSAVANGLDIRSDCYPYTAFCTAIGQTTYDGDFLTRYMCDISQIEITEGPQRGPITSMEEFQQIRAAHPEYLTIAHVMKPEEVDMALLHPRTMLGSDGILNNGAGHPRAAGAFPRFIREYVYERQLISLYDAVGKMTCQPAARFRLNKGTLRPGADADIVIFNPLEITDRATFAEPQLPAAGIDYVFVNGQIAMQQSKITKDTLGKYLRRVY